MLPVRGSSRASRAGWRVVVLAISWCTGGGGRPWHTPATARPKPGVSWLAALDCFVFFSLAGTPLGLGSHPAPYILYPLYGPVLLALG